MQPIQHTLGTIMPDFGGQWASRGGPGVVLSSIGWHLRTWGWGWCVEAPIGAPDTMWGPHMYATCMSSSLGCLGVPGEVIHDQLGRNVGGIEQPVGAAALLYPQDASMMLDMHMHHHY
jgi:hypothetical protein